jgi:hypothetical protein
MTAHDGPAPRLPELEPHELRAQAEADLAAGEHGPATAAALLAVAGELALIRRALEKKEKRR